MCVRTFYVVVVQINELNVLKCVSYNVIKALIHHYKLFKCTLEPVKVCNRAKAFNNINNFAFCLEPKLYIDLWHLPKL